MLESNTFRSLMAVGGVIICGLAVMFLFTTPIIEIDAAQKDNYEQVMDAELDDGQTKITAYEAVWFSVKGMLRGNVSHY